jgi:hypothetical protein
MSVCSRLERAAAAVDLLSAVAPRDIFAAIEQHAAYLRGEGPRPPDPPCRPWFDPAEWTRRLRTSRCLADQVHGALGDREYLPDMDAKERRYLDGLLQAFTVFAESQTQALSAGVELLAEGPP